MVQALIFAADCVIFSAIRSFAFLMCRFYARSGAFSVAFCCSLSGFTRSILGIYNSFTIFAESYPFFQAKCRGGVGGAT